MLEIDGLPLIIHTFKRSSFAKKLDDLAVCTDSNDIKEIVIDSLVEEFRISLNSVVFGDPAGREYVESLNQNKEDDSN